MSIERLLDPPRAVPLLQGQQTLYEVDLTAEPSPAAAWRTRDERTPPEEITPRGV